MRCYFLAFMFVFSISLKAQYQYSGLISDAESHEKLVGANVIIPGHRKALISDAEGRFQFTLDADRCKIRVSFIGYKDSILELSSGKSYKIALLRNQINMPEVVLSATRDQRSVSEIPARVDLVNSKDIEALPALTTDELFYAIPGMFVNRSWGIFSKNASVTMRGLEGSQRVLVLLNGAPLNKAAGGGVNWNLVPVHNIQKVELIKGPSSAIYGYNAMSGVINIITKEPETKMGGMLRTMAGSMGALGASLNLGSNRIENGKGWMYDLSAYAREGDGYILEPEKNRDSTSAKAYMKEAKLSAKAGYQFKPGERLMADFQWYDDKRGTGSKVFEEDGSYLKYTTQHSTLNYSRKRSMDFLNLKAYFQHERYFEEKESVNSTGDYKLSQRIQHARDFGLMMNYGRKIGSQHYLTLGSDLKSGHFFAEEIYRTSSDYLNRDGDILFAGLFLQDEWNISSRLKAHLGARMDVAGFNNGSMSVVDPTKNTGFQSDTMVIYPGKEWFSFSPKASVQYSLGQYGRIYLSASSGFMPAKLDDLCSSRKINKGFKIANPELDPERLDNLEFGFDLNPVEQVTVKSSVYYSLGRDFQYFVGTGDTVDTGGTSLKPVYRRENISSVEIYGAECSVNYSINDAWSVFTSYAYGHSRILDFDLEGKYGKDLSGKELIEVPDHTAYLAIQWKNRILNLYLSGRYVGNQWYDDENTIRAEPWTSVDLRVYRKIGKQFDVSLNVQDVFNQVHIDRKGLLSPGRFFLFEIGYHF